MSDVTRDKVRIRFRKAGDLRFLSHHDLMRMFERMLRRADLPFRTTEGFHPKPKMAFASALALGIVGHEEVIEIEFDKQLPLAEIQSRLAAQAPAGLAILSVAQVDLRVHAQPLSAEYHIDLDVSAHPELPDRLVRLFQQEECWVERSKPQPRRVNIRPFLLDARLEEDGLRFNIRITPNGSARPEEVLQLLGLGELLGAGGVLERTKLVLEDELANTHVNGRPGPSCEAAAVATEPVMANE